MKKVLFLILLLGITSLFAYQTVERPFLGDKRPARSIKISDASKLNIKSGDNVDIVVSLNSSVQNGAWELRRYLEKILNLPVFLFFL